MKSVVIISTLLLFFSGCVIDVLYNFAVFKNKSTRNVVGVFHDGPVVDTQVCRDWGFQFYAHPGKTVAANSGFGPPVASRDHIWYLTFYDNDTILKYCRAHRVKGMLEKAFLFEDSVTQQRVIDRDILITYKPAAK